MLVLQKKAKISVYIGVLIAIVLALVLFFALTKRSYAARQITFPVLGGGSFSNDFDAPRGNGPHHATDIFAPKHTPLVAAVDGTITFAPVPQPSYGYMVRIVDAEGYEYNYIHINNDNDGTDDGNGGPMKAYAPDVKSGNRVVKGQHIGWLGDSGNAENTPPHLHFEIYDPNGNPLNPYESLPQAPRLTQPNLYPPLTGEVLPYGEAVNTTVQLAAGNLDADSGQEYVTGAGQWGGPHVRVFNEDNSFGNYGFFAYDSNYRGGVNVATGDIEGDGIDEIITGTGSGSTSHVKIFRPNGQLVSNFFAYGDYRTGVNVTACDIDNDGGDEIITGTGAGNASHVKVFEANSQLKSDFFAYPDYYVGADVACGDTNNDDQDEIITAAGPGGGSHVKTFTAHGQLQSHFFAYPNFYGGVRVDVGNVRISNPGDEILTAPYSNGGPDIRLFGGAGNYLTNRNLYESWWSGNFDVAAGTGKSWAGTGGNRRASIRSGPQ